MNGIVMKLASTNDTGRIAGDDGGDRFYHPGAVEAGAILAVGDTVKFADASEPGTPARAVSIRRVKA